MKRAFRTFLVICLTSLPLALSAGERAAVEVECRSTEQKLVYDCSFSLKGRKSNDPIPGAEFSVGADMPSMPGAHNIRPVAAEALEEAGAYQIRIELDMVGEWNLILNFSKPSRDRLVKKLYFGGVDKDPSVIESDSN